MELCPAGYVLPPVQSLISVGETAGRVKPANEVSPPPPTPPTLSSDPLVLFLGCPKASSPTANQKNTAGGSLSFGKKKILPTFSLSVSLKFKLTLSEILLLLLLSWRALIGAIPMVTMTQSAANWRNTHTHMDGTHSLTHLHQHCYNHVVRSASSYTVGEKTTTTAQHYLIMFCCWCSFCLQSRKS